ncbi:hypothetical protein RHMOL_Rhmol09G0043800 [Rhododendron molle]|uniref:Uncharacterized protein n=1 Tax=Rhododendron molle TaxID=49168 RepID=A0ACC0M9X1_RHOML|nr:hypothetical protein RHMOL_Rhmol09G0043800 [Rhododendron molle]
MGWFLQVYGLISGLVSAGLWVGFWDGFCRFMGWCLQVYGLVSAGLWVDFCRFMGWFLQVYGLVSAVVLVLHAGQFSCCMLASFLAAYVDSFMDSFGAEFWQFFDRFMASFLGCILLCILARFLACFSPVFLGNDAMFIAMRRSCLVAGLWTVVWLVFGYFLAAFFAFPACDACKEVCLIVDCLVIFHARSFEVPARTRTGAPLCGVRDSSISP